MSEIIYKEQSYKIMGACFEVYRQLGPGFLEETYHQSLKIELGLQGIPYQSKPPLPIMYKGHQLETLYQPDFVCFDAIILEIKSVQSLADVFRAKVIHYLKLSGMKLGLLVNFCHCPEVEYERIVL